MSVAVPRGVLLLELQDREEYRQFRAELFPFIQGFLEQENVAVRWRILSVPPEAMHGAGRFVVDVPDTERHELAEELARDVPDIVLTNNPVAASVAAFVGDRFPEMQLLPVSALAGSGTNTTTIADLQDLLSCSSPAGPGEGSPYLVDAAEPSYLRTRLNGSEIDTDAQPLRLVGGATCLYRRAVSKNPRYRHLDVPAVQEHRGCSFCILYMAGSTRYPYETSPADLAARQILAHQRHATAMERGFRYIIEDAWLSRHPEELFSKLLEADADPCHIYLNLRIDDFLAIRDALAELLADISVKGHRIQLLAVGAENFSDEENERFNKNITAAQLEAAFAQLCALEERYPESFLFRDGAGFSAILFTPWTTVSDLRVNLQAGRQMGVLWTRYLLGTRLQVVPGSAIEALAQDDGLLAERFSDAAQIEPVCLTRPGDVETPWRFAEPETESAHRLLIRLEPVPRGVDLPLGDTLAQEVNDCRRIVPPVLDRDYIGLMQALLSALESLGAEASVRELFEWIRDYASAIDEETQLPGLGYGEARLVVDVVTAAMDRWGSKLGPYSLRDHELKWKEGRWSVALEFAMEEGTKLFQLTVSSVDAGVGHWLSSDRFVMTHGKMHAPVSSVELRLGRGLLRVLERNMPKPVSLSSTAPADPGRSARGVSRMQSLLERAAARRNLWPYVASRVEIDPGEGLWSVAVDATLGCNLSCVTCAEPKRTTESAAGDVIDAVGAKMTAHAADIALGCLNEPLVHPDIGLVVRTLASYTKNNMVDREGGSGTGAHLCLLSSGTLLRKGTGRTLAAAGLHVALFSIDSTDPEAYARIRGGASWEATRRRLAAFMDEAPDLRVVVQAMLTRTTLPHAKKTVEDLAAMGVRTFQFTQPTQVPQSAKNEVVRADEPDFDDVEALLRWADQTDLDITTPTLPPEHWDDELPLFGQGMIWDEDRLAARGKTICVAPWFNLRVDHRGDVYPCNLMRANSWGNVRELSFNEIVNHANARHVRQCFLEGRAPHDECLRCPYGPSTM